MKAGVKQVVKAIWIKKGKAMDNEVALFFHERAEEALTHLRKAIPHLTEAKKLLRAFPKKPLMVEGGSYFEVMDGLNSEVVALVCDVAKTLDEANEVKKDGPGPKV